MEIEHDYIWYICFVYVCRCTVIEKKKRIYKKYKIFTKHISFTSRLFNFQCYGNQSRVYILNKNKKKKKLKKKMEIETNEECDDKSKCMLLIRTTSKSRYVLLFVRFKSIHSKILLFRFSIFFLLFERWRENRRQWDM